MEVTDWGGGLTQHEVKAIEQIKETFQSSNALDKLDKSNSKSISLAKLQKSKSRNTMFPWKGYSGFRLADGNKEGEFDLVIITHCNVLIIELKDWNYNKITRAC